MSNSKWMQNVLKTVYLRAAACATQLRTSNTPVTETAKHLEKYFALNIQYLGGG